MPWVAGSGSGSAIGGGLGSDSFWPNIGAGRSHRSKEAPDRSQKGTFNFLLPPVICARYGSCMHEAVGFAHVDVARTLVLPMVAGRANSRHPKKDMTCGVPGGDFRPGKACEAY